MRRIALVAVVLLVAVILPLPVAGAGVSYSATLSGDQEVPPVDGDAFGWAWFKLNPDGSMDFKLMGHKLSGDVFGAHIHAPAAPGQNAGVVVTLCGGGPPPAAVVTCTTTSQGKLKVTGTIGAEQAGAVLEFLDAGTAYVNVHTPTNPGGEIRGQIG